MASITRIMSAKEIQDLYERLRPLSIRETKPPYSHWSLKTPSMSVTAYQSGKVLFQGDDLSWLEDSPKPCKQPSMSEQYPQAGSDEVGTGDYFGPIVVAAVIVPDQQSAAQLHQWKVTDSKAMTDDAIRQIAPKIEALLPHSIVVLENAKYNQIYHADSMNMNRIKSWLHNQVYLNLQKKGFELPGLRVIDQFCPPERYYAHLSMRPQVVRSMHFETKAESKYPAVAAASVLARARFLQVWDALEEEAGMPLAKGGGPAATQSARLLKEKIGLPAMNRFVKLHFANTSRL